jgi:hypothetical protein
LVTIALVFKGSHRVDFLDVVVLFIESEHRFDIYLLGDFFLRVFLDVGLQLLYFFLRVLLGWRHRVLKVRLG